VTFRRGIRQQRTARSAQRASIRTAERRAGREANVGSPWCEQEASARHVVWELGLRRSQKVESDSSRHYGRLGPLRCETPWLGINQSYFVEDCVVITRNGSDLLNPPLPMSRRT